YRGALWRAGTAASFPFAALISVFFTVAFGVPEMVMAIAPYGLALPFMHAPNIKTGRPCPEGSSRPSAV
ncbi:MAG TPA: hypothetical protein VK816_07065, partial [Jatrophihabitantaceae bacterium]|nr:hypothetical protein [Jatrophihabitantaceae bacterium]